MSQDFFTNPASETKDSYVLNLYITGSTPQSLRAVANIKFICEEHLAGRYQLQVIDIFNNPGLAEGEQIIAAPTLVKLLPEPVRRLVGDMSNFDRVLVGLDLSRRSNA